jgi:hypothetical protein
MQYFPKSCDCIGRDGPSKPLLLASLAPRYEGVPLNKMRCVNTRHGVHSSLGADRGRDLDQCCAARAHTGRGIRRSTLNPRVDANSSTTFGGYQKMFGKLDLILKAVALVACVVSVACGSARADGSSQPYSMGGKIGGDGIIAGYNQSGELFRIEGYCRSSCTTLLAIRNSCVDPNATLAFHAAILHPGDTPSPERNNWMLSHYNGRLRSFLVANNYLASWDFHEISGSDIIRKFGYRRCPSK